MSGDGDARLTGQSPADFLDLTERLVSRTWGDEDFVLDGIEVRCVSGIWFVLPELGLPADMPAAAEDRAEIDWAQNYLEVLTAAWGQPMPHIVLRDEDAEDDSIVDVLLRSLGFGEAMLWERGERTVVVASAGQGQSGVERFNFLQFILPSATLAAGISGFTGQADTALPVLMHGEDLAELHRRTFVLAAASGLGEQTVGSAQRCEYLLSGGGWAQWTFTAEGTALLLISHAASPLLGMWEEDFADGPGVPPSLLYAGLPDQFLDLAAASAESPASVFDIVVDGRTVPRVTGVFWFDGETWRITPGLMEVADDLRIGLDDFGLRTCVCRPLRVGGSFDEDSLPEVIAQLRLGDEVGTEQVREALASCPHPPGTPPSGDIRMGTAIPGSSIEEILDDIDSVATRWWHADLQAFASHHSPFHVGGRNLESHGDRELVDLLAASEPWFADAFEDWTERLTAGATARWGPPRSVPVVDAGRITATPLSRHLRGQRLADADVWRVRGLAVSLMVGTPATAPAPGGPNQSHAPVAMLAIMPPEATLDPFAGTHITEVRQRLRILATLAGVARERIGWDSTDLGARAQRDAGECLEFDDTGAEAIRYVLPAPGSDRDTGLESYHAWHLTHDNRALLITRAPGSPFDVLASSETPVTFGGARSPYERQSALFTGVPADLVSLVADRSDADSAMTMVRRADGRSLPAATGIFWFDGLDWCVATGLLAAAHEFVESGSVPGSVAADNGEEDTEEPMSLTELVFRGPDGLVTAAESVAAGADFTPESIGADEAYCLRVLGRVPALEELEDGFGPSLPSPLAAAQFGDLNDVLDVLVDAPEPRFLLDAALANAWPASRFQTALWLLGEGFTLFESLAHSSPLNVLLDNEILDEDTDARLIRILLDRGCVVTLNQPAPRVRGGGHPVQQLCDRDVAEAELLPFYEALFADNFLAVDAPVLPGGESIADYVSAGVFPHGRDRSHLRGFIERAREVWEQSEGDPEDPEG